MTGDFLIEKGKVLNSLSTYQPSPDVRDLTVKVKHDYQIGWDNLNRPFDEFNGLSFIGRMNEDQKAWLSWNPGPSNDPEEDWRWFGVRPITRNKIISTAAHLTSRMLQPNIFAQNELDEDDKDFAYVMKTLVDYNIQHSNYEISFLYGVISGLVNPVSYFKVDYCQATQEILERTAEGYKKTQVIDDELSGFQNSLIPADEILFANPYEFSLQKQTFLIHKKLISFDEAEAKYGDFDNWKHVKPGIKAILGEDGLFYDVDDQHGNLVEEVRYYNRRNDEEVIFINGIYFGSPNVEWNPIQHRTNKNKPKYPFVKYGAEPVDAMRFYGYKSLAAKMSNDQELIDRQWQMAMDGSFLDTMEPLVTIGAGKVDKSMMIPAAVTDLPQGAQVVPGLRHGGTQAAFQALREGERSISESSLDVQLQGQSSSPDKTARGAILEQQNAETNLGMMGRMIGFMVKEIGDLMVDNIIRYQTVGEIENILGGIPKMKFKTFIVNGRVREGKSKTDIIKFTDRFSGKGMSKDEKKLEGLRLLEKAGDDKDIFEVNPAMFRDLDFLVTVDYDQMMKRNTAFERAFKLEIYDRAIVNPFIDQEAITRDFLLEPLIGGEASKYVKDVEQVAEQLMPQEQGGGLPKRITQGAALRENAMPVV